MLDQEIGVGDPAPDIVVALAAHQIEVGQRQHRDRDAGIGHAPRQQREFGRRQRRELGHVADHHPAAAPVLPGQLAHQRNVERLAAVADIEMNVDLGVEFARQLEDPADLPGMIGIVARRAADRPGPALQPLDESASVPG